MVPSASASPSAAGCPAGCARPPSGAAGEAAAKFLPGAATPFRLLHGVCLCRDDLSNTSDRSLAAARGLAYAAIGAAVASLCAVLLFGLGCARAGRAAEGRRLLLPPQPPGSRGAATDEEGGAVAVEGRKAAVVVVGEGAG